MASRPVTSKHNRFDTRQVGECLLINVGGDHSGASGQIGVDAGTANCPWAAA